DIQNTQIHMVFLENLQAMFAMVGCIYIKT
ncbi:unnamed protein product, partial [marine sediment metagenome]